MGSELLQAEGNTLLLVIEVKNDNVELLADFNKFMRIVDTSP